MASVEQDRRDWNFDTDGPLVGRYVEARAVTIKNGPSAGQTKPVLDLHVGLDDELVTWWPSTVARRKLREELQRRGKPDFEPGEEIGVTRKGEKEGPRGRYFDDDVVFEFQAPKPTTAELLGVSNEPASDDERPEFSDDAGEIW